MEDHCCHVASRKYRRMAAQMGKKGESPTDGRNCVLGIYSVIVSSHQIFRGSDVACLDRVDNRSDLNFDACLGRHLSHRYHPKVGSWVVAKHPHTHTSTHPFTNPAISLHPRSEQTLGCFCSNMKSHGVLLLSRLAHHLQIRTPS